MGSGSLFGKDVLRARDLTAPVADGDVPTYNADTDRFEPAAGGAGVTTFQVYRDTWIDLEAAIIEWEGIVDEALVGGPFGFSTPNWWTGDFPERIGDPDAGNLLPPGFYVGYAEIQLRKTTAGDGEVSGFVVGGLGNDYYGPEAGPIVAPDAGHSALVLPIATRITSDLPGQGIFVTCLGGTLDDVQWRGTLGIHKLA